MDQGRLMLPTMQRFERTVESKDAVTPRRDLEIETSANAAPLARTSASVTAAVVRLLLRIEFRFMRVRRTTSTLLTRRLCRDGTFRAQEPEDSTCTHDPDPLGHHCSAVANANDRGWSKGGLSGITAIDCNPKRHSISSPGAASLPCAILEEGVSLPSPGAKATTLRCGARPPALQCSPPQSGRARACGSAMYLLPKSPAPSRSSVRRDRWCAQSPL